MRVAIFTDNDFDKINGVTTTLRAVLRCAPEDIRPRIYTFGDLDIDVPDYLALSSFGMPIPFYAEMRMYLPRFAALRRCIRADRIQLIHLTTPGPSGLAARYLAGATGLPLIGSFHTHLSEYAAVLSGSPRLGRLMGRYLRWIYGRCEQVLVPSADTRDRLSAAGWAEDRLVVWARGVDCDAFSPARRSSLLRQRWGVSDKRPAILYAGRVSHEKGLARLQEISAELYARRVAHRLIVVGGGPMLEELKAQCPDAVFMGSLHHSEVGLAMASADVFLFPSETDTAGNVVLEAQASGLPALVTDVGGPRENIDHGITGFACRSRDTRQFCDRLEMLLTTHERRAAMSAAARARMLTRSWVASLAPLYASYRAIGDPLAMRRRADLGELGEETRSVAAGL